MADITAVDEEEAVDPLLRLSENNVESLIAHLARREIVESVRDAGVTSTLMPDVSESRLASYKLSDATLERLWRMALSSETERAELDFPARPRPRDDDDAALEVIGGRYEVRRFIGEGGTSSVYEGYDVVLRRRVAIKILRQRLRSNEGATNRFLREARLTTGLRHPNLVETFELVSRQNELAIVMELVEGELLSARLRRRGAVPPREAVRIAVTLADVLDYLQRAGLARLDVKPHNIVLNPYRGAVVIDLGLAKNVHEAPEAWHTQAGVFVGTPAYMAPEQIHGGPPSIQGDLFALGLVLYTCLNGENPYEGMPSETAMWQIVEHDIDVSSLRISDPLRTLLRELLQRDPVRRSHDPAAVREVLRQTPEYRDESSDATGTVMDQALDSAETSELPREEPGRSSEAASSS
jgi:serine/threonine-protein kinase